MNSFKELTDSKRIKMTSLILSPEQIYQEIVHKGELKTKCSHFKFALLSILAGIYVSMGFSVCLIVGGLLSEAPWNPDKTKINVGVFKLIYGAVGFPFGFTTIMVCGAELYTGICAYMTCTVLERKCSVYDYFRIIIMSWIFNYVGCMILIGLFIGCDLWDGQDMYAISLAKSKLSHTWGVTFAKGIMANWLVCIATWMATAAQDLSGKAIGIWLPIAAFVMLGFEHCIANQYLITLVLIRQSAGINAYDLFVRNLIPSTLGNWVGGSFFVATIYSICYGHPQIPYLFHEKKETCTPV